MGTGRSRAAVRFLLGRAFLRHPAGARLCRPLRGHQAGAVPPGGWSKRLCQEPRGLAGKAPGKERLDPGCKRTWSTAATPPGRRGPCWKGLARSGDARSGQPGALEPGPRRPGSLILQRCRPWLPLASLQVQLFPVLQNARRPRGVAEVCRQRRVELIATTAPWPWGCSAIPAAAAALACRPRGWLYAGCCRRSNRCLVGDASPSLRPTAPRC